MDECGRATDQERQDRLLKRILNQARSGTGKKYTSFTAGKEVNTSRKNSCMLIPACRKYSTSPANNSPVKFGQICKDMQSTAAWMVKGIYDSREKDYSNEFRKMMYDNQEEMDQVIGKLEDNSFIQEQMAAMDKLAKEIRSLKRKWRL